MQAYNAAVHHGGRGDGPLVRGADSTRTGKPATEIARTASNWLISDCFGALNRLGMDIATAQSARRGEQAPRVVADGTLFGLARQAGRSRYMLETGEDPAKKSSTSAAFSRPATQAQSKRRSRDHGCQRRQGSSNIDPQGQIVRLLRRPDDAGDGRKGNPQVVNELLKKALADGSFAKGLLAIGMRRRHDP
jgi:aspartyl-tRNA(Asn)/glutamyl-tRNA(Gln) amidotransferase subunit B